MIPLTSKKKVSENSLQPLKVLHNALRLYRIRTRQVPWDKLKSHALDITDDQLAYCIHRRHTLPQLIQVYYTRGSHA